AQISLQQGETEHDAQVNWYHNDVSGLPRELTGTDGSVVWRAVYRAWGNTLRTEQAAAENAEPVYQPLRYQGQYFDAETGLHYNRFRYYDPDAGRFVSQDPIGLAGGVNLYQYAPNPLSWIDPLGLARKCEPSSPGSMQKEVERGQAPREIERVDRGHIPGQEAHVHYSDGTSSNLSGGIHDAHRGVPKPTKKARKWLISHGWTPPE
ncbi:UNVERIFIED_ORG: RHS repeat-associated protein, partial [Pantoea agglomerans]